MRPHESTQKVLSGHDSELASTMRLADGEILYTLLEAQIIIAGCRHHHNAVRPHDALP